jgi:hypothetical protein
LNIFILKPGNTSIQYLNAQPNLSFDISIKI